MSVKIGQLRRSALAAMVGACLLSMSAGEVMAQSATGAIAGRADPGAVVTITNPATGFTRSVTVGADGTYRLGQLPVGNYQVSTGSRQGVEANVALGGTTTVNLAAAGGDSGSLDTVQVVGNRVMNRVDVRSIESATNVTREELARMPVDQSMTAVAMLAPGVTGGNSSFGGISFGGSSVAENSAFVNGLNVTDFYRRRSFSSAPFAFFEEFQVKTGGYSVEFGRSTGGVINAVTRRGTNEFHGGIEMTFEPAEWRSKAEDHSFPGLNNSQIDFLASHDERSFHKTNLWASGPLVKDRLFAFVMYEFRDTVSRYTLGGLSNTTWNRADTSDGFWGAKVDWRIADNHLLELLAFSDGTETGTASYGYTFPTAQLGSMQGQRSSSSGGNNGSLTYTGYFGDNFVAKAMYGINRTEAIDASAADGLCSLYSVNSTYNTAYAAARASFGAPPPNLGCHPGGSMVDHHDERKVGRLDFEWTLGNHLLRFGLDREVMQTQRTSAYPGDRMLYTLYGRSSPTQVLDNGTALPAGVNAFAMGRRRIDGGTFETTANAWYLEDNWSVTPNFLLNLGVRVDAFDNKTAAGGSFIKMDKLVSPRLGFSWDMRGDGGSKLFGNLGRYYLPVTNNINYTFAGGLIDERSFFPITGWTLGTNPITGSRYITPTLGAQIGPVDTSYNVSVGDLRQSVDREIDAVYQDEAILGYQAVINEAWSWGVNGTYRRMKNALDDIRINALCGVRHGNLWPIANPGGELTLWGTRAIGCAQDGWVTIDTSREGYMMGGSNRIVGYFEPKRTYKSVEFQIDRAWDGKWAFNASYLWSKSEGNHEGPVNSDTNYGETGMVQHWDHPANNERYGVLFNDHTHQIKLRAAYALTDNWSFGATLRALSGGPITAFGVTWPGDSTTAGSVTTTGSGGGSGWLCTGTAAECTVANVNRPMRYTERGEFGRMPWTYDLGANVTWSTLIGKSQLKARLSVFNLLNNQEVVNVQARYEGNPGQVRPEFGTGTRWQSPRYAQMVVSWNF